MVFGRKGLGGPQIKETQRMLATTRTLASACAAWRSGKAESLSRNAAHNDRAFQALRSDPA
jgi:hypothetical protein